MRLRVWGCRGSLASPGPDTIRYGGNTSCVEVRLDDGPLVILDAGSGIRPLGAALDDDPPTEIHVLLTHLHLDHLQGLAFFAPLWRTGAELHIWGPRSPVARLDARVATYLSPPLFPIHLSDVPARCWFHDVPDDPWQIGSAIVAGVDVSHQGPTVGFRIEEAGRSLAYIPDHEPSLGIDLRELEPAWVSGHALADGVDVLLHDAQYTEDEYPRHVGWGHSSVEHVVTFARLAGAGRLVLFHHDPRHDDAQLEAHAMRAHELWGADDRPPLLAREGMTFDLGAPAPAGRSSAIRGVAGAVPAGTPSPAGQQ